MDAYFINLESATERRLLFERNIAKSSLPITFHRFNAIKGNTQPNKPNRLSNGQWGCYLSHMQIIENSTSDQHLLIIEDDEIFNENLYHIFNLINELQPIDWDLLYLDMTIVEVIDYLFISSELHLLLKTNSRPKAIKLPSSFTAYGTHAYIVNKTSKKKVKDLLCRNLQLGIPIDNIYCAAIQEGKLSAHIALPLLIGPGSETKNSQINNTSHPLEHTWIRYRQLISIQSIINSPENYLSLNELERITKFTIHERLDYSCLNKFSPYQDQTKSLR